ncbi:hypothetical protein [Cytophaga aurantiaca]|uniref:hypothetical protein n=1 Tax=Cytophaga aurantiaca TaxID=29530 RepID=UPI001FE1A956|nr:hypothetical protein [Cytophaga aurantiaca]
MINGLLLYLLGIKYAIDTTRFESEATAWINGEFEPSYRLWYCGYIAILFICKSIFHSIYPSIIFQYLLSLISTVLFYKGLSKLIKNEQASFYSTLLILCYMPIQQWNTCLLTESIFISLLLLFVWAFSIEKLSHKWFVLILISILAATVRPNGGILFITCIGGHAIQLIQQKKTFPVFFMIGIAVALLIVNSFTDTFYQFLLDSFNKGEVICGYDHWTSPHKTHIENNSSGGSITKIIDLISSNPVKSMQLFVGRFIALWSDVRAYYSLPHNIFIGIYLLTTYSAAIIGFIQYRQLFTELTRITLLYCGINSVLVMVTYADWDGRFLAPLLPMIFIWSGLGIYFSIQFLKRKNAAL